jgi:hypothetical protein
MDASSHGYHRKDAKSAKSIADITAKTQRAQSTTNE